MDDAGLLKAYLEKRSEAEGQGAFRALVDRHVNMVYSVCRRQLRDEHWAEDVTQAVFILLAKKAPELPPKVILGGWLYKTAVFACSNARQLQRTRSYHESRVMPMKDDQTDDPVERAEMEGLLDEALLGLSEAQREVLVLRFFENKPLTEIAKMRGETMYATEKAHQTGLEKLRRFLSNKGIKTTAAILITVLAQQTAQAAPVGLAATCAGAAMGSVPVAAGVTDLVTRMVNHAIRLKFFAGAGIAAGCVLLATTVIAATSLMPSGPPPGAAAAGSGAVPVAVAGLSPAQQAADIAALENTLRQVEQAVRQMDQEALGRLVTFSNLRQARQWEAMGRLFEADQRLKDAARMRFGPAGVNLTSIQTFGERLDQVLPQVVPESNRWHVETRTASLQFAYKEGGRAGGTLFFVRDGGPDSGAPWRLDAGRSLDIVLEGLTTGGNRKPFDALSENEQGLVLERMDRLERAFKDVHSGISLGSIRDVQDARRELEKAGFGEGRAFFNIALKFDATHQARSLP